MAQLRAYIEQLREARREKAERQASASKAARLSAPGTGGVMKPHRRCAYTVASPPPNFEEVKQQLLEHPQTAETVNEFTLTDDALEKGRVIVAALRSNVESLIEDVNANSTNLARPAAQTDAKERARLQKLIADARKYINEQNREIADIEEKMSDLGVEREEAFYQMMQYAMQQDLLPRQCTAPPSPMTEEDEDDDQDYLSPSDEDTDEETKEEPEETKKRGRTEGKEEEESVGKRTRTDVAQERKQAFDIAKEEGKQIRAQSESPLPLTEEAELGWSTFERAPSIGAAGAGAPNTATAPTTGALPTSTTTTRITYTPEMLAKLPPPPPLKTPPPLIFSGRSAAPAAPATTAATAPISGVSRPVQPLSSSLSGLLLGGRPTQPSQPSQPSQISSTTSRAERKRLFEEAKAAPRRTEVTPTTARSAVASIGAMPTATATATATATSSRATAPLETRPTSPRATMRTAATTTTTAAPLTSAAPLGATTRPLSPRATTRTTTTTTTAAPPPSTAPVGVTTRPTSPRATTRPTRPLAPAAAAAPTARAPVQEVKETKESKEGRTTRTPSTRPPPTSTTTPPLPQTLLHSDRGRRLKELRATMLRKIKLLDETV